MYEAVVAERPSLLFAQARLGYLLAVEGNELDRSLALAERSKPAARESASVADAIGYIYLENGRVESAMKSFRGAIHLARAEKRDLPLYHYHLGLALRALARRPEAAEAFARALAIDGAFGQADDARRQLEAIRAGTDAARRS